MSEHLCLKWNNHSAAFLKGISKIQIKEKYCDATIVCQGKFFPVHRIILSTCSEYFDEIFDRMQCQHPYIVFKDIEPSEMEMLLNYMYQGEVNVTQEMLSSLIKAAEALKIKGLAVPDDLPSGKETSSGKKRNHSCNDNPQPKKRMEESRRRESSELNSLSNSENRAQLDSSLENTSNHSSNIEVRDIKGEPVDAPEYDTGTQYTEYNSSTTPLDSASALGTQVRNEEENIYMNFPGPDNPSYIKTEPQEATHHFEEQMKHKASGCAIDLCLCHQFEACTGSENICCCNHSKSDHLPGKQPLKSNRLTDVPLDLPSDSFDKNVLNMFTNGKYSSRLTDVVDEVLNGLDRDIHKPLPPSDRVGTEMVILPNFSALALLYLKGTAGCYKQREKAREALIKDIIEHFHNLVAPSTDKTLLMDFYFRFQKKLMEEFPQCVNVGFDSKKSENNILGSLFTSVMAKWDKSSILSDEQSLLNLLVNRNVSGWQLSELLTALRVTKKARDQNKMNTLNHLLHPEAISLEVELTMNNSISEMFVFMQEILKQLESAGIHDLIQLVSWLRFSKGRWFLLSGKNPPKDKRDFVGPHCFIQNLDTASEGMIFLSETEKIVFPEISALELVIICFASYYVLDISYPRDYGQLLGFLQSCLTTEKFHRKLRGDKLEFLLRRVRNILPRQ